jgi:hypothetical protein
MTSPPLSDRSRLSDPRRHCARAGVATAAILAMVGIGFTFASPVFAGPAPILTVSGTSVSGVDPGSTTTLSGVALSGDTLDNLQVSVTTDSGSLTMTETDNLTLATGYSWSGTTISFTGSEADDNTGLASLELVAGDAGTATISVSAFVAEPGLSYSPSNGHFYQYFADSGVSWSDAQTAAATQSYGGLTGYLATIPDATVNTFVADNTGASNIWFGAHVDASDTSYPRVWKWTDGPLAGGVISNCDAISGSCDFAGGTDGLNGNLYSSWASGEPNNSGYNAGVPGSGEDAGVTNWGGSAGLWNDLSDTAGDIGGYLVEYGNLAVGSDPAPTGTASASSSVEIFAAPAAPTSAAATTTGTTAIVTWTAPGNDGGTPVTGYTVIASPGGATCTPEPSTDTTCTVTGLTKGTVYAFTVRATNTAGTSDPSGPSNPVTPLTTPGAPTGLSVAAGNDSAALSFTAPADNGGTPITGYQYSADGGVTWHTLITTGFPAMTATLTGLPDGTPYGVAVRAGNTVGEGLSSPIVSVTPYSIVGVTHPAGGGYLTVSAAGHVYSHDGAISLGSTFASGTPLTSPVVGIAAEADGGYIVVTAAGNVYNFRTTFYGSPAASHLRLTDVVGVSAGTDNGYLLVTANGRVFHYHTAFHGSPVADHTKLISKVVGITSYPTGGYLVVTGAGNIYNYGTKWFGSPFARHLPLTSAVVGIAAEHDGGYVVTNAGGHVYAYKTAWVGSPFADTVTLSTPIIAIAAGTGHRYALVTTDDTAYGYPHH